MGGVGYAHSSRLALATVRYCTFSSVGLRSAAHWTGRRGKVWKRKRGALCTGQGGENSSVLGGGADIWGESSVLGEVINWPVIYAHLHPVHSTTLNPALWM